MVRKNLENQKKLIEKLGIIPVPPVLGKVERVYTSAGKSSFLNCLYSADVRLIELKENGEFADSDLVIPDIPILAIGVGNNRGIFFLPENGTICKVSFLYGELSYPVIDGFLPYLKSIPGHPSNDMVEIIPNLWKGKYNKVELTASAGFYFYGDLFVEGNIKASKDISDWNGKKGSLRTLRETYNVHIHTGDDGGNTSQPHQIVGEE